MRADVVEKAKRQVIVRSGTAKCSDRDRRRTHARRRRDPGRATGRALCEECRAPPVATRHEALPAMPRVRGQRLPFRSTPCTDRAKSWWRECCCALSTASSQTRPSRGAVLQLPQRRTLRRVRRKSTLRPGDSGALHGSCEVLVEGMLLRTLHSKFADAAFSLAGLELAEARSFSFLSGGRSAVYGVNLPCDQVILALDASTTSSETLAQSRGGEVRRPTLPFHPLRRRHAYGRIGIIYGRGAIKTNGVGQRDLASCTKRNPPRCSDCECFLEHVYGFRRQRSGAWCKTRIIWGEGGSAEGPRDAESRRPSW